MAAVLADEDRGAPVRPIEVEEREAHRVKLRRPLVERGAAAVRARHLPARELVSVIPAQSTVEAFEKTHSAPPLPEFRLLLEYPLQICGIQQVHGLELAFVEHGPVVEHAGQVLRRLQGINLDQCQRNPVLLAVPLHRGDMPEHVGHLVVTANIVKKDLLRDPGLHRSMFANGLSTVISGFFGSTPNTTYGENIGVMAITRVYSTWVIGGAAIFAILLSCVGKLAAAIQMIPLPVMGGVSLLLYGVIGASGIRVLIESKVDYNKAQNLILTSVILIIGVSGAKVNIGAAELKGMALATIVGIGLSLIFKLISVLRPEEVVLDAEDADITDK